MSLKEQIFDTWQILTSFSSFLESKPESNIRLNNKMTKVKLIDCIFTTQLILFGLIITGLLPREASIFLAVGLAIYVALAPIEDATIFFVRSIPLFIAIPITAEYDNLNTWRILSAIIFIKWIWPKFINFQFSHLRQGFGGQAIFNQFSLLD